MLSSSDLSTELLISQLLEDDLKNISYGKEVEQLQLDQIIDDSTNSKSKERNRVHSLPPMDDEDIAAQLLVKEVHLSNDISFAQTLQHSVDASNIASKQLAQKWAAAERKILLDAEFARRLQAADDGGEIDTDDPQMRDAESVLGKELIDSLMASDLNDKGKGKKTVLPDANRPHSVCDSETKKKQSSTYDGKAQVQEETVVDHKPYPVCGICLEPFQPTHSPVTASLSANSSSRLVFGLRLPCPDQHAYCMACLAHYIKTKLEPEEDDAVDVVFPIRCPECPRSSWELGIQDEVAERLLDSNTMVIWHHRKLLDSLPRYYCPNPRCSTLLQVDDNPDEPEASCPACQTVICITCRALWHTGMTCEEYQSLPLDERSPEDQLTLQLAKTENWRRCPSCSYIIELTHGCHHVICRCAKEFCFKCGSSWDTERSRCTSNPPCDLWEENMLLDQRERDREAIIEARERRAVPVHVDPPPPRYNPPAVHRDEFEWLNDPDIVCHRHLFTKETLQTLTCGYCDNRLNSLADLQYHLSHVRYHPVYACCGKLFKRDVDFDRHVESYPGRFGSHINQIERC